MEWSGGRGEWKGNASRGGSKVISRSKERGGSLAGTTNDGH